MKILLFVIGKTDNSFFSEAFKEYQKRLSHYINFEYLEIPDIKNTKNRSVNQQKIKEGESFVKNISPGDYIVLLDEKGKEYTSSKFANYMEKKIQTVPKRLIFLIGGPYGFSEDIYNLANEKLTLSKMTFSHQMVRVIFIEQLYRAMTIINNEPYHHE